MNNLLKLAEDFELKVQGVHQNIPGPQSEITEADVDQLIEEVKSIKERLLSKTLPQKMMKFRQHRHGPHFINIVHLLSKVEERLFNLNRAFKGTDWRNPNYDAWNELQEFYDLP